MRMFGRFDMLANERVQAEYQRTVHAHRFRVRKPKGTTPDRDNELLDQLQWGIAPV